MFDLPIWKDGAAIYQMAQIRDVQGRRKGQEPSFEYVKFEVPVGYPSDNAKKASG